MSDGKFQQEEDKLVTLDPKTEETKYFDKESTDVPGNRRNDGSNYTTKEGSNVKYTDSNSQKPLAKDRSIRSSHTNVVYQPVLMGQNNAKGVRANNLVGGKLVHN